ncbi:MAG TPA: hypothetical protein VNJ52_01695 [Patescibacteria group bacterium]|nr:hypothetical protein [Patescibacteria group bacterium]
MRPGREAVWLVSRLESTEWHSAYAAWKAKHASIPCRVFHGDGSALYIADLWTYRCTSVAAFGRASDFFYILNPTATPESELDQFQGEILQSRSMPISVMQKIHDQIESLLTGHYGQPDAPQSVPAAMAAWGSGDWRLLRIWHGSDRDICLYTRDTPGEPVAVGLLARDRALMLSSTSQGTELLLGQRPAAAFEDSIDSRLAADLKKEFPAVAALLGDAGDRASPRAVLDALNATIDRAIDEPQEVHAELLFAADRLVARLRLPDSRELPAGLKSRLDGLRATAGMHFSWDELGASWVYHHDLLWGVWRGAPQTEWGQDAFFLLLDQGWDTSGVCQAGADQFRAVIALGDKFLEKFPDSPALRPVMFLVAQANETWWSLSEWSSCSPVTYQGLAACAPAPQSARYLTGAGAARERAISEYKALLEADPGTYGTPEVRRSLARMELGIDTNQRRFYCLYN